ncbi:MULTISPECIES: hypothetical protein [Neisseria]|uniref:hypothetical protein n=1 Tax=Neisseria sp. HMSC070A01 TaxID=1715190 RepID=UPI001E53D346|nr:MULTISPECIES: hypothetical protein [Neisseria]
MFVYKQQPRQIQAAAQKFGILAVKLTVFRQRGLQIVAEHRLIGLGKQHYIGIVNILTAVNVQQPSRSLFVLRVDHLHQRQRQIFAVLHFSRAELNRRIVRFVPFLLRAA